MTWVDWIIAAVLLVGGPIGGIRARRELQNKVAAGRPDARTSQYIRAIGLQWTTTVIVLALWLRASRPLEALGLVWPSGPAVWWTVLIVGGIVGLYTTQALGVRGSSHARQKVRAQLESRPSVRLVLPTTPRELQMFMGVAMTAGFCEEVLFRGYLFWFFSTLMPFAPAVVAAVAAFGIGHAYQGVRDVFLTAAVGALALGFYLLTDSLVAPIAVHMTLDLANGFIAYTAFGAEQPGVDTASRAPRVG